MRGFLMGCGFSCCGARAPGLQAHEMWLLGSRTQAHELWHTDLVALHPGGSSRPGIEPMSPALAGRFFTTEPPGKPFLRFVSHIDHYRVLSTVPCVAVSY